MTRESHADVLVVGAGPTGLTLAAELAAHGVRPRLVDRARDRVHESRALAIQPRTLEALARRGITGQLVAAGNPAVRLRLHARGRETAVPLFDLGLADTAYPYLLFLSQAHTERVLADHLSALDITVERGVELAGLQQDPEGVTAALRHDDGHEEQIRARYVVGCDGAHSTVRGAAGIGFHGGAYPQTFVLADTEADGLGPDAAHAFLSGPGILFFFPLGSPAAWRLLAMRRPDELTAPDAPVSLDQVQALADTYTGGAVRLRDPVWMTNFRIHHRVATSYRAGPVFLAGDAAHIHSPAGAQGMNTGIQDAVNLGWKLAYTLRGLAIPGVLDTYEPERAPVGRMVLRFTDRAFRIATSTNPLVRLARNSIAPALIPLALGPRAARAYVFRTLAQLNVRYRSSRLSLEGPQTPPRGPKAGDRLPDAPIVESGRPSSLQAATAGPGWHLLRAGPAAAWPAGDTVAMPPELVTTHHLGTGVPPDAGAQSGVAGPRRVLHDPDGVAFRRLGLAATDTAVYLVRPDGYIGYRSGGPDLAGAVAYLGRWVPPTPPAP
jgi:2-polyprenyl-6-methoxyphenol hydroxylase-like FAD-dependent oxidoreductase